MNKNLSILINNINLGYKYKKLNIKVPNNKLSFNIINQLCKEGIIRSYKVFNRNKHLLLYLNYENYKTLTPIIHNIKIISKPSRRIYLNSKQLKNNKYYNTMGNLTMISTPLGNITLEKALEYNQGGEILFVIN